LDHTVVHFEIPANNPEKLSGFYRELFGWKFEKMKMGANNPSGEMDYWMIETRPSQNSAGTNGGMMKRMDPNQQVTNYVMVESVDDFAKKAQQLGGKIIIPKTPIPNMGAFAVALDPEGNPFGIFEASST
jgi:predicted enzyme related to lactoylglutathione lyase